MNTEAGVREERTYFLSVIKTFKSYREQSFKKIQNKERSIGTLPNDHKKWLEKYNADLQKLKEGIEKNSKFIPLVLEHAYTMFDNVYSNMDIIKKEDEVPLLADGLDKVQSVFKQIMRDWSSLGASERKQCYEPIIEEIISNYPEDKFDRSQIQVLVPGAGLGRLAFEIASRGFKCQGNEFNLFMLIVSFYVLNLCQNVDEYEIYPWIHQYCNNISVEDQMLTARMIWLVLVVVLGSCYQGYGKEQPCDSYCLKDAYRDNAYSNIIFYDAEPQPNNEHSHCSAVRWNRTLFLPGVDGNSTSSFWYPGRRVTPYGAYEYTLRGPLYGKEIDEIHIEKRNLKTSLTRNCLVQVHSSSRLLAENCSSYHKMKCIAPSTEVSQYLIPYCSACPACKENSSKCIAKLDVTPTSFRISDNMRVLCPECFKTASCSSLVNMVLTFNEKQRSLYLALYSPECIYNYKDPSFIYCFTDATDKLKQRIAVHFYMYRKKNGAIIYKLDLQEFIGTYWCEAHSVSSNSETKFVSNNVTAYRRKRGNEFAAKIKIDDVCNYWSCDSVETAVTDFLIDYLDDLLDGDNDIAKVRLMKVFEFNVDSYATILIHFSMLSPGSPTSDYEKVKGVFDNSSNCELLYLKSSDYCLAVVTRNLTWPTTLPYQVVLPEELCLRESGMPVWRMCGGDFLHGYEWMEVKGNCSTVELNEQTKILHEIYSREITKDVVDNVTGIVHTGNISVTDLFYVSRILERFSADATSSAVLFETSLDLIDGLLTTNSTLLTDAQHLFNLTDAYLRAVDHVATNWTDWSINNTITITKNQILTYSFNPLTQNASGFVMFRNRTFRNIHNFSDVEEWVDVDLALCVSDEDIDNIAASNSTNVSIVVVVYLNNAFFPSSNVSTAPNLVMNLNIPNYDTYLKNDVLVLVRSVPGASGNSSCAFWDYGDASQQKKGAWSSIGGWYGGQFADDSELRLCSYSHLTHLALLMGDRINYAVTNDSTTDVILSWITATGSILSCFGIGCIFLTALTFKSWRSKTGTQILLNLSVAILLEIVFLYVNDTRNLNCTISGFVLQYVVLCKFCWMLVYAYCQYLRFVRVLSPLPKQLVLKSILVGWGFGLIPSITVLLADPQSYNSEIRFCYPTGLSLYLGVYLPVLLILFVNLGVFCKILFEINKGQFEKVRTRSGRYQHVKLAILLCSVLGIPWIIGFLFNVLPVGTIKTVFIYIFTITSVLQGFVMFLFYVVFNPETKSFWSKVILNKTGITSKGSMSVSIVS